MSLLRHLIAVAGAAALVVACVADSDAPLRVRDLRAYAPAPGSRVGVAYLTLVNASGGTLSVDSVSSPEFGRAEFHASVQEKGVASMRRLDALRIPPSSELKLEPGGYHLMLHEPVDTVAAGTPLTLVLRSPEAGELVLETTLSPRSAASMGERG